MNSYKPEMYAGFNKHEKHINDEIFWITSLLKIERGKMSAFEQIWFWRSDYGGIQANNQLP